MACPVEIVERAEELRTQLAPKRSLPDGYKPEDQYPELADMPGYEPTPMPYNVILAEIRHEYTNYEDLLYELPLCPCADIPCERGGTDDCPCRDGQECQFAQAAHESLKWAAKGLAEQIYREWVEKRQVAKAQRALQEVQKGVIREQRAW